MSDRPHPRTHRKTAGPRPPAQPISPARAVALRVLGDLREGRKTARESIDALLAEYPLAPQDLGLANELVMGVVRHRLTLARIVGAFATHGWKGINHRLQSILLLATYQIVWLDGIPAFAAVHEAVEQAKAEGGGGAGRFVNGVLRQLLREIVARRVPRADASPTHSVPVDREQSCQFARAVLPDPTQKPAEHLADATSHPVWLVQRWIEAFGKAAAEQVCLAGMSEPPLIVRPNLLRTTVTGLMKSLQKEGYRTQRSDDGHAVHVAGERSPIRSEAFARGLFQPQDRTAMDPVLRGMPDLASGQTVVDYCAGLGTKATQMAEVMRDAGRILACEVDEPKLAAIRTNVERLGSRIIETCLTQDAPARVASLPGGVDWILVDVPCSNTGVLGRRPEARYRLNVPALLSLAELQLSILESAAALAGRTTRLVYSTCSIDPEENGQVLTRFLAAHPEWRLADSGFTLPDPGRTPAEWRDGGYWARLERKPQP